LKILGLNTIGFNTSASLIINGELKFAVEEERLSREKRTRKFPILSINYILKKYSLKIEDFEAIAISWNPGINLEKFDLAQSEGNSYIPSILHSVPNNLFRIANNPNSEMVIQDLLIENNKKIKIFYINHHLSHASSFYFSKFKKANILTLDAFGEKQSGGLYYGSDNKIQKLSDLYFPHSLGSFYSTFTQLCGFKAQSDEWKLMGASAYGEKSTYYNKIKNLIDLKKDGTFELDLNYFNHYLFHRPNFYNEKLLKYLNIQVNKSETLTSKYYNLAHAAQSVFEDILFHILNNLYKKNKNSNLVFAGGCALNCLANGKIIHKTNFKDIFIPPVPDDSGAGAGAAFYVNNNILNYKRKYVMKNNYLGPESSNFEIKKKLSKYKLDYRFTNKPEKLAASMIANGKIIGWFQGRLEFGDRALGNRSILADPRQKDIKDRINKVIKYREIFRPFAPALLDEKVKYYFEEYQSSDFMEKTVKIKNKFRKKLPGITHSDGTGRLQTVKKINNPKFYELIKEFYKLTSYPIVINTSLNYKGDPVCASVEDAIKTYHLSGLDCIIIGNYYITKK
jgi:carbamoyltransferase